MRRNFQVVVIGDSREIEINNRLAKKTGQLIAVNGWTLISGGRGGVMAAASQGAAENNGRVVALLPDWDFEASNPYADVVIPTGIGYARNSMNVLAGDAVVVIGGGAGTLSEMAYAWTYQKPIFALTQAEGWSAKLADQALDSSHEGKIFPILDLSKLETQLQDLASIKDAAE